LQRNYLGLFCRSDIDTSVKTKFFTSMNTHGERYVLGWRETNLGIYFYIPSTKKKKYFIDKIQEYRL